MKYGSGRFTPFKCSNHVMLKQMRQWQNAFTFTLVLMCIGVGLSHNIEASLSPEHGEHCSICISGNCTPVAPYDISSWGHNLSITVFQTKSSIPAYKNAVWPYYTTRAPPLV